MIVALFAKTMKKQFHMYLFNIQKYCLYGINCNVIFCEIFVYLFKKWQSLMPGLLFYLFNKYKVEKYIACKSFAMHKSVNTCQPWLTIFVTIIQS